ncbi:hypothetical protein [Microvirga zambiensis]|uniref:hypothetical protein n=1 Tax=Microvirga zambiensis TaxID=1402137 RepID=UPI00191E79B8|nr:hypothetical protein [Microvirga zambiensis]
MAWKLDALRIFIRYHLMQYPRLARSQRRIAAMERTELLPNSLFRFGDEIGSDRQLRLGEVKATTTVENRTGGMGANFQPKGRYARQNMFRLNDFR